VSPAAGGSDLKSIVLSENDNLSIAMLDLRNKRFVFLLPPLREKADTFMPTGILVLADLLREIGWQVDIINIDLKRYPADEVLRQLKEMTPDVVGWSAVAATAYAYVKEMTQRIKDAFPGAKVFLGGNLCSVADRLLHAGVDIVFVGEAEVSLPTVCKRISENGSVDDVPGIVYMSDGEVCCTGPSERMSTRDRVKYLPRSFEGIDLEYYMPPIEIPAHYGIDERSVDAMRSRYAGKRMVTIAIQRGCQASCTFCHRNSKYSPFLVSDVVEYMRFLRDHYDVCYFRLASESFIGQRQWILDFSAEVNQLGIIFDIGGARVDKVDYDILNALKDAGCVAVEFGYESGSQIILEEMAKGVALEENVNAAVWTKQLGLGSTPQLILGYPGESVGTLLDTVKFIRMCRRSAVSANMLQVLPGTPVYHYAVENGHIPDEEQYLLSVSDKNAADSSSFINMTPLHRSYLNAMRGFISRSARYSDKPPVVYYSACFVWALVFSGYLLLKGPRSLELFVYIVSLMFRIDVSRKSGSSGDISVYMREKCLSLKCGDKLKYGCR